MCYGDPQLPHRIAVISHCLIVGYPNQKTQVRITIRRLQIRLRTFYNIPHETNDLGVQKQDLSQADTAESNGQSAVLFFAPRLSSIILIFNISCHDAPRKRRKSVYLALPASSKMTKMGIFHFNAGLGCGDVYQSHHWDNRSYSTLSILYHNPPASALNLGLQTSI